MKLFPVCVLTYNKHTCFICTLVSFLQELLLQYYLSLAHPSDSFLPALETLIASLQQLDSLTEEKEEVESPASPTPSCDDITPGLQYDQETAPFPQTYKTSMWQHIKDVCESSTSLKGYLHIALACRSICIRETQELTAQVLFPIID